ncbi:hypothetical protein [Butyrivibrio sp. MB2005]|uniref:hypothetical protein n=1 Tax=Butyrivibrio sp. MB2005 TaxID=1280678 RepID=UPI000418C0A0|nr:hypothetical protein [Butyrivibrio sp. MB2005]
MEEQMKKIGRQMGIIMGILMSFSLSLVETLASGKFTIPSFLIAFVLSAVISVLIGFAVPVGKITADVCRKFKLERGKISTRVVESLISDIIYTPIITLVMTAFFYKMVMIQSGGMAQLSFIPMFIKGAIIGVVVAFFLIFIFQPMILGYLMKKNAKEI